MTPIRSRIVNQDFSKFPTTQLFVLALVRLAEPIALTSLFPYAWQLVLTFDFGDESDASLYAGILISAFALAEALTGMYWGGLSDRIGRKPVLILGSFGTMVSLIIVGLSTNFWIALLGRAVGGALNGNIGVIQTMVGELVQNPKHEPKAYSIMPFVWAVGTIIGPCIGGYFAQPAKNFPDVFTRDSLFGHFPYLLPNLICVGLMLASIAAGWFLLEETHPEMRSCPSDVEWQKEGNNETIAEDDPLLTTVGAGFDGYGTISPADIHGYEPPSFSRPSEKSETTPSIFSRRAIMLTIALGIFTYHSMTYDHLLPIFLQDRRALVQAHITDSPMRAFLRSMDGGLGISTQQTGVIMSVNGVIALIIQAVIFPWLASWLGIWKTLVAVTIGHPLAYFVVPFLAVVSPEWLYTAIYACLSLRSLLAIVAYPLLLILLKEASPSPRCLGKINGLAASVGAACRTLASPIAGYLYGLGMDTHFTGTAWWASALIAVLGAVQILMIQTQASSPSPDQELYRPLPTDHKIYLTVEIEEVDSGYNSAEERAAM